MIKKNDESGKEDRKVSSFKKFSEMSGPKPKEAKEDPTSSAMPDVDSDRPANPNLPYNKEKVEKPMSTKYMMPNGVESDPKKKGFTGTGSDNESEVSNEDVKFYGKVAKLPKGVKASKGYNFLENVKVSKSSIWYIMVEKQENELQMVKYNYKKGVDLAKFVGDLKTYYISQYAKNPKMVKLIEAIEIDGNDKYSWVKNIPLIEVDGRKMISRITEDLIKLLSK
jgi:hypothetical protein